MKWKDYYKRTFKSVYGVTYSIVIQKKVSADEQVECKEMQLAYDCPVLIEWNEVDRLEPVQSLCMTLKVVFLVYPLQRNRQFQTEKDEAVKKMFMRAYIQIPVFQKAKDFETLKELSKIYILTHLLFISLSCFFCS